MNIRVDKSPAHPDTDPRDRIFAAFAFMSAEYATRAHERGFLLPDFSLLTLTPQHIFAKEVDVPVLT